MESRSLDSQALGQLFGEARTHGAWLARAVDPRLLREIYDLMKWGPTSANSCPGRILYVTSQAAKDRLIPCMSPGNVDKTRNAPVTALIAADSQFYERMNVLFPIADLAPEFRRDPKGAEIAALRNSSLQGAYFMLAARALGLDCGPMLGFDAERVNQTFFANSTWRVNFICNLGYGDKSRLHPRLPRLSFEEACRVE